MSPRDYLIAIGKRHPGIWRIIDALRQQRLRDDPQWPDHVYLPLEKSAAALVQWYTENDIEAARRLRPATIVGPVSELAGLAAWRVTQGIYRYDPTLYAALVDTPVTGDIPGDVLTRLPEWCVYLETPGLTAPLVGGGEIPIHGVWAWIDRAPDHDVLTLLLHLAGGVASAPVSHVPLVGTLDEALSRVEADWRDGIARGNADGFPVAGYAEAARRHIAPIVSLLLYLCAEDAEVGDGISRPSNPQPKRTKLGWRIFPADKPATWDVGVRLGAALRRAYQRQECGQQEIDPETGRARPRAHIRRAHWHTYRHGAQRALTRLRWLPPIAVNLDDVDGLPAVVRQVKP